MKYLILILSLLCASPLHAAITFVNAGAVGDAASGNITLGAPATPATNDTWIAVVFSRDNVAHTFTDWTQLFQANGSTSVRMSVWYHRYAGATPGLVVTHTAGNAILGGIASFRGVDTVASPADTVGSGNAEQNATNTVTHLGITPSTSNTMLLAVDSTTGAHTRDMLSTGFVAAFLPGGGNSYTTLLGSDGSVAIAYKTHTSGATGNVVLGHNTTTAHSQAVLIALEQAATTRRPQAPMILP